MGPVLTSFLLALGACAWLYPKIYNRSGADNTKQTLTATAAVGVGLFIVILLFINLFL